jgi:hypothetical protein
MVANGGQNLPTNDHKFLIVERAETLEFQGDERHSLGLLGDAQKDAL